MASHRLFTRVRFDAVDHSIVFYLMGPDGKFIDFFSQLMTSTEIVERIEEIVDSRKEKHGFFDFFGIAQKRKQDA
jgi:hypothetical protein